VLDDEAISMIMMQDMNRYWIYIMTNAANTVLYTGVTNELCRRIMEHRDKRGLRFTSKYNITKLVYYEDFDRIQDAIAAEKKIKAGSRAKKIKLIESTNPGWEDLYSHTCQ
jgi:putative endonuclease